MFFNQINKLKISVTHETFNHFKTVTQKKRNIYNVAVSKETEI